MQFMQGPQGNQPNSGIYNGYQNNQPGSNQMPYLPGQGSAPSSQRLNDPYQQQYGYGQGAQSGPYNQNQMAYSSITNSQAGSQRMFDPSSPGAYQGYYSSGSSQVFKVWYCG